MWYNFICNVTGDDGENDDDIIGVVVMVLMMF